jgi:hypothetical protein
MPSPRPAQNHHVRDPRPHPAGHDSPNNVAPSLAARDGFEIPPRRIQWDSHAAAVLAYQMAVHKTAFDTAGQFAIFAKRTFGDALKAVGGWPAFVRQTGSDTGGGAVFAGINSTGEPDQVVVSIFYSTSRRAFASKIKKLPQDNVNHYVLWADGSDRSVIREFGSDHGLTFRADLALRGWEQTVVGKSFDEKMSLFAVQLATWVVMYTKEPDIGSPFDCMVLTRTGIADHRKTTARTIISPHSSNTLF